ncbi:MAG: hypothetical protein K8U57_28590 [Planctomycetes bacterium]|nr:hypothetical protein [Planctomycetota bacterium]
MQNWFPRFVDETVKFYLELNKEEKRAAFFEAREHVRAASDWNNSFTGFCGERVVQERLKGFGQVTKRTKGSKSPADVWGASAALGGVILALVQVKAARQPNKPAVLTAEHEETLGNFSDLVWTQYFRSTVVPLELRTKPLIIATSYAGVQFDDVGLEVVERKIESVGVAWSESLILDDVKVAATNLLGALKG